MLFSYKKTLILGCLQLCTFLFGQSAEVDLGKIDPEKCRTQVARFQAKFNEYSADKKIEQLKEAKNHFEQTLEVCPKYSENNYFRARFMMEELLRNEPDVNKREVLLSATFKILDLQLQYFEGASRTDMGTILGIKGRLMFQYGREVNGKSYTIETKKLQQAIEWMQKAVQLKRQNVESLVLVQLFQAKKYAYKLSAQEKNNLKLEPITQESLIADFVLFNSYLDGEIAHLEQKANANPPEKGAAENLKLTQKLKTDLQNNFLEISNCKDIETAANRSISGIESKVQWEETMRSAGCHKGNFYIKIAEEVCDQKRTVECYGGLVLAYLEAKNMENAFKNVQKVVAICENCPKEKEYKDWAFRIALEAGKFSVAKQYATELKIDLNYVKSREIATSAVNCQRRIDRKAAYWLAYDYMKKAIQQEKNETERKKMEKFLQTYQASFPDQEELFNEGLKAGEEFSVRCFPEEKPVIIRVRS